MKKHLIPFGAALTLALFITGCESDGGITARIQEKSSVYATLKQWDKNYIAKGVVSTGFTADMVYMAVGSPTKVEPVKTPDGRNAEVWTYDHYYPTPDASHMGYATYSPDSNYKPATFESSNSPFAPVFDRNGDPSSATFVTGGIRANQIPTGASGGGAGPESIATTGGPQGGSMEPGDLQAFTLMILFQDGKVVRLALKTN